MLKSTLELKNRLKPKWKETGLNTSSLDQSKVEEIRGVLLCLIDVDDSKEKAWLREREASFREHHKSHPQPIPPPAAVDWLWVDLGTEEKCPEIEVPPYEPPPDNNRFSP